MSRYELKEEYKQTEGDPYVRQRQRQRMMEMARRRMLQDVRKADVVVTNPVTYAVALRYDRTQMSAASCGCQGQGSGWRSESVKRRSAGMCRLCPTRPSPGALYAEVEVGHGNPHHALSGGRRSAGVCSIACAAGDAHNRNGVYY